MAARRASTDPSQSFIFTEETKKLALAKLAASGLEPSHLKALQLQLIDSAQLVHPSFDAARALVIPYFGPDGAPLRTPAGALFYQIRYLSQPPGFAQLTEGPGRRYSQEPESGSHAYFPPLVDWRARPIECVTEGAFKAASASAHGVATVGLLGVDSFAVAGQPSLLLPELDTARYAPLVTLIFDSDPVTKTATRLNVSRALGRLEACLRAKGVEVRIKRLPSSGRAKVGLDDFIVSLGKSLPERAGAFRAWFASDADLADDHGRDHAPPQSVEDYVYLKNENEYLYLANNDTCTAVGVDASVPGVAFDPERPQDKTPASTLIRQKYRIDSRTWHPAEPRIIRGRTITNGGWVDKHDCTTLNEYRAPVPKEGGVPAKAKPWLDLIRKLYPENVEHLLNWFASKVQFPGTKIQHALVLGGGQGIGKDSLLKPVYEACGRWNCQNISPHALVDGWTGHVKSVILTIDEAADTGADEKDQINRRKFYEQTKTLIADTGSGTLEVNEKYMKKHKVFNVVGVIFTTNSQFALYLAPDDRRHYVCWSLAKPSDFNLEFYTQLHTWYAAEGLAHVEAFLRARDLSGFNPNVPPPKTDAWQQMVGIDTPVSDGELNDTLEKLGHPDVFTVDMLAAAAPPALRETIAKPRLVAMVLARAGFTRFANPTEATHRWCVNKRKVTVYCRADLALVERAGRVAEFIKQQNVLAEKAAQQVGRVVQQASAKSGKKY
jgi:hypothetical protein